MIVWNQPLVGSLYKEKENKEKVCLQIVHKLIQ